MAPAGRLAAGRPASRRPVAGEHGQEVTEEVAKFERWLPRAWGGWVVGYVSVVVKVKQELGH